MTKIRMKSIGKKKFIIVNIDSRKRNSKKLTKIGFYDLVSKKKSINKELLLNFVNKGSLLTNSVKRVFKNEIK